MSVRRWWVLALAVALAVMASRFLMVVVLALPFEAWVEAWMREPGWGSALLVVLLLSIDLFLPIPSSLVMVLSGVLFGTLWGGILSLTGSLVGNYVGFELARAWGRDYSRRLVGETQIENMSRIFERYGAATVIASRPLPIVMETLSVVAGLAGLGRATFVGASLVGTLPVAFAYAFAGTLALDLETVFLTLLVIVIVPAFFWWLFQERFGAGEAGAAD